MSDNRKTLEKFITDAAAVHNGLYTYPNAKYIDSQTKLEIDCAAHGSFLQTPNSHVSGKNGCPKCSNAARYLTTAIFIERASKVHNNKYTYELVNYTHSHDKQPITCPNHGIFLQVANEHLNGKGCRKCSNEKYALDTVTFIKRAIFSHGYLYGYDCTKYINFFTPIDIRCYRHGIFSQIPANHLSGEGCLQCKLLMPQEEFIRRCIEIHGDKYYYSLVLYLGSKQNVIIICKKHGVFEQKADIHINGGGCKKCTKQISMPEQEWLASLGCNMLESQKRMVINGRRFCFDGYDALTKTVFEFLGSYWHGDPVKFNPNDYNETTKCTFGELYEKTMEKELFLKESGYKVVSIWESDWKKQLKQNKGK